MRLIVTLYLFIAAAVAGATDFAQLEKMIRIEMTRGGIPGVAVVVVQGGQVVYNQAFGVTSAELQTPATPDTLFRLGSTSKVFTALALAARANEGKLRLDQPAGELARGLAPGIAAVTLRQLLTHTAGLADNAPMEGPHDDAALGENVRAWGNDAFFTSPGRIYSYANPGYVLAGFVLEQNTSKPFADAVRDLVLAPLGMASSTYRPTLAMTYPLAVGHRPSPQGPKVARPMADHSGAWPPGSLFSSGNDLARFLVAMMNAGKVDGRQAIPAEAVALVTSPAADVPALGGRYGMGVLVQNEDGRIVWRHTGGRDGYGSVFHILPEQHIGVAILANRTSAILSGAARMAVNLLAPPAAAEPPPKGAEISMSEVEAARYAGVYANGSGIRVELLVRDGQLIARLGPREVAVKKTGELWFSAPGGAQLESFRLIAGADGTPEFLTAEHWALRKISSLSKEKTQ